MKVIKLPDEYDVDLFCEDDQTVLKSDEITKESVRCPFCNSLADSILFLQETEFSCFCNIKDIKVYTECSCSSCGSKWESNKHSIKNGYSYNAIHKQVQNKCRKIMHRDNLII